MKTALSDHRLGQWLVIFVCCATLLGCTAPRDSFAPIFDGESFVGWKGDQEFFRIDQGAIIAGNLTDEVQQNRYLCTLQKFQDFELRLEVKATPEAANGGVQFWSERAADNSGVVGYQADLGILEDPTLNIWGALYDQDRRRALLAVSEQEELAMVFRPGGWNDYLIRARWPRMQFEINGYQTIDYTEDDLEIAHHGIICLQRHVGAASEIRYRNLEIHEFP